MNIYHYCAIIPVPTGQPIRLDGIASLLYPIRGAEDYVRLKKDIYKHAMGVGIGDTDTQIAITSLSLIGTTSATS